ncbi:MFS transporter [Caldisalinibacter kiritimatiensis]|uniref:Transporter n=1 Tax=Caldisalinibacter kiritimatiensis TaxID=1304284 RepID=R1CDN4_9FIRM|nr:MFS transporter [Caldisalinibacter kiritimatiensis]EOD00400.1 Transporter [Caldisalinibacter kiritimatiensis]
MSNKSRNDSPTYYRWLVWGILALAYVIVFFHRVAAGVVRQELIQGFNITDVEFGNLGAMYFYAYTIMQIPSGIFADTLGARKTVTVGTLLAGVGSIIFGIAPTIGLAYIGRLVVGLGVSVVFISILKVLSQWFSEEEFGRMSGLTSFVGNGGALLAQFPLVVLVSIIGWRLSFGVIGVISVLIAVLTYIIVRNKPEEKGFEPVVIEQNKRDIDLKESIKIVFSNPRTWPGFFVFGGMFGSVIAFMGTWGVPYMIHVYDISKAKASTFTMTMTIGIMIGSLIVGFVSDKMGKRKLPFFIFSVVYLFTWIVLLYINPGNMPFTLLYILFFLIGFSASGFVLSWASAKEVNPREYAGISTGTVNMGGFLFAALIQPLIGYILNKTWTGKVVEGVKIYSVQSYNTALLVCLVAAVIGVVGVLFVKETNCRNIYEELKK